MPLTLHYHPLSSFCWKTLVGLYETGVPFDTYLVDLMDGEERGRFLALSPFGKMPALVDSGREQTVSESSIVIEYVERHYGGLLIPQDVDAALRVRLLDRLLDNYLHHPMQRAVAETFRPDDAKDPFGLAQAKAQIRAAYEVFEPLAASSGWLVGDSFTLADCSACPALWYGDRIVPISDWPNLTAYLERLKARASFARVLEEAQPYMAMFPGG